jgi:hypothetical protein
MSAGKTEVVVLNHDFDARTSQDGGPAAANPELGCLRCSWNGASVRIVSNSGGDRPTLGYALKNMQICGDEARPFGSAAREGQM